MVAMKTEKSTFRILFYLKRTKTLNNGKLTIFMRITINGERAEISTHQNVESHLWNQGKAVVKGVSNDVVGEEVGVEGRGPHGAAVESAIVYPIACGKARLDGSSPGVDHRKS